MEDIGLRGLVHLRDILGLRPHLNAKDALYRLFRRLVGDFNGDLFNANLEAEANVISSSHIETVDAFFRGTDITTGEGSFWPYDFEAIPIETISAIYERFLNADQNEKNPSILLHFSRS